MIMSVHHCTYVECTLCHFFNFTILPVPFVSEIVTSACGWGGCYYIVSLFFSVSFTSEAEVLEGGRLQERQGLQTLPPVP